MHIYADSFTVFFVFNVFLDGQAGSALADVVQISGPG